MSRVNEEVNINTGEMHSVKVIQKKNQTIHGMLLRALILKILITNGIRDVISSVPSTEKRETQTQAVGGRQPVNR